MLTSMRRSLYVFLLAGVFSVTLLGWSESAVSQTKSQIESQIIAQSTQSKPDVLPQAIASAVRSDLAKRLKTSIAQIKIKKSSRQTWSDGCLGIASANEMCTQALVEGWRVVLVHNKRTWTYRTNSSGKILRLETDITFRSRN
jgi:hypothetical protein